MKKVSLCTFENGEKIVSGTAEVEVGEDGNYQVAISVYPGSALARRLSVRGDGNFSIDFKSEKS
jgi:hypothetical protein